MAFDAYTSDPHYGHANVIRYSKRPFLDVEDMNEALIKGYNDVVPVGGTCLFVGGCFLCGFKEAEAIMRRLNGRKFLVLGNHDRPMGRMAALGFELVAKEAVIAVMGCKVQVTHLPYANMPSREDEAAYDGATIGKNSLPQPLWDKGKLLMHGHTHSTTRLRDGALHVGVDAWGYRPAPHAEVEALVRETVVNDGR